MRSRAPLALVGALLVCIVSDSCLAAIQPISSVDAGVDRKPPYVLRSVTVGDYTVTADFLATGRSTGRSLLFTSIRNADNLDLNSIASRNDKSGPVWQISSLGGQPTWKDYNGDAPDFFLFEAGMNDSFTVQAVLPGGELGQTVYVDKALWGNTGLRRVGLLYNDDQPIGGLAFAITDLLDPGGRSLTNETAIAGIRIISGTLDPASFSVVVPEPATLALLGLGAFLALRRRP